MMLWRLLVAMAVVVVPGCRPSTDPVSKTCEPLCQYELEAERQCAMEKGCYDPDIANNDVLFIQCWQPCWKSAKMNCLSVCRAQYSSIKQKCSRDCANSLDKFCPGFCFAMTLDTLVHGSQTPSPPHGGGGPEVKPPGTHEPDSGHGNQTPPGPTPEADDTQQADDSNQTTAGPVHSLGTDDDHDGDDPSTTPGRTVSAPSSD